MERIDELNKKITELNAEISPLKDEYDRLRDEKKERENKKLIGTCWRTRNRYSGDEEWWLYSKVIGTDGSSLVFLQAEETVHDRIEIVLSRHYGDCLMYQRITPREFQKQYKKLLKKCETIEKKK
jgi:hypothetical protein